MKNNSYYTSFEKYQFNPSGRYIVNKYINNNANYNNISFETQNNYLKRNKPGPYSTIVSKSNKNLKYSNLNTNEKSNPSYNKNYYYRDYYETEEYQPYDYGTYDNYNYQVNWNMRPFDLYTQSTDLKKNNQYQKNDMYTAEENSFQADQKNHSYYESKFIKKNVPIIINNNNNNNYKNSSKNINSNQSNIISNISLNKNNNKNSIIKKTGNGRYIINNSPTTKRTNETYLNILNGNKISRSVNIESDNTKNLPNKKTSLKNEIQSLNQINNTIPSFNQPKTPSVYSHNTIRSPIKNVEDESYIPNSNKIYYNRTEKNVPSKSLEKIAFRKLVFNYQNTLNNVEKNDPDLNKPNLIESFKSEIGKVPYTPQQYRTKNLTNIYKSVNEDNKTLNNDIIINIKNKNEDKNNNLKNNNLTNNNLNTESNIRKNQIEIISKQLNKNNDEKKMLNENNDNKLIKSPIKQIQINNSNNKNTSPNNIIISTNKSNNGTINQNKKSITNSNKKLQINQKKYQNENENKPINDNKEITSNKSLNYINLPKGRNEPNINMNKRYSHVFPMTEIKKTFKSEVMDINNSINNNNQIIHNIPSLPNLNNINKNNKIKTQEVKTHKLTNNIINNKKISSSKNNIKEEISKIEQKNVSNLSKKNVLNTIPEKNLNQPEKISNTISKSNTITKDNLSTLNEKEKKKEKDKKKEEGKDKERPHRFQSEMLKYESRAREKSIKKEEKKDDDWDDIEFKGMRKTTYDPGRRGGKKNKEAKNKIKEEFHSTIYIKKSEALTLPGKNEYGNRKTNQDTFVLEKNVNGVLNFNIFGVLDGHGDNGHFASQFVSRYVIYRIKNHPSIKKLDEPKEIYNKLIANGYKIIANIYLDADIQIKKEKFDVTRSGTTIVLVIQLEEHIICANTGDSRAIAIYDDSYEDKLVHSKIYPLSYDCKPNLPNEEKRINECGGVVEKAYYSDLDEEDEDEIPYRVWAKGEDYPGLAMSRSIGDMDAKKVGVIPNPQIVEYTIDYFSKYLLLGSDGIWEFISNEDAMKIANKFYLRNDPLGLCHELTDKATKLWEEKDVVTDDITILAVFF